jgi:hypothetical protein
MRHEFVEKLVGPFAGQRGGRAAALGREIAGKTLCEPAGPVLKDEAKVKDA